MAFLSDHTFREIGSSIIHPFDPDRLTTGTYELSLHQDSRASGDGHTEDGRFLKIPPGQFAYLFSNERVSLRNDMLGFISIKSKHKWDGLINISGFHVDPGYEGMLKFAVYNAGSGPIFLKFGDATFQLWLATFDQPATPYNKPGCSGITTKDLAELSKDVPSPSSLSQRIEKFERMPYPDVLQSRLNSVEAQLRVCEGVLIAMFAGWMLQTASCTRSQPSPNQPQSLTGTTGHQVSISTSSDSPTAPHISSPSATPPTPNPKHITPVQNPLPVNVMPTPVKVP